MMFVKLANFSFVSMSKHFGPIFSICVIYVVMLFILVI